LSISSVNETGIIINSVEESDTLDDIIGYITQHVAEWSSHQVLWDLTLLDFNVINSESIRSLIQKGLSLSEKRTGLKTALLVDNDLGFGMMRMLQILSEERLKIEFGVFRGKDEALEWLNE
jgi:hypothetical protein